MTEQPVTPRNPVKEVRQACGLTQEQMAHELGCVQSDVWRWEHEGTLPHFPPILAELGLLAKQAGIELEGVNEHGDWRGVSRVSLVIKWNTDGTKPCSLCGKRTEEIPYTGPMLCIEGTNDAVCLTCGEEHAPELVEVLAQYFGSASKGPHLKVI